MCASKNIHYFYNYDKAYFGGEVIKSVVCENCVCENCV